MNFLTCHHCFSMFSRPRGSELKVIVSVAWPWRQSETVKQGWCYAQIERNELFPIPSNICVTMYEKVNGLGIIHLLAWQDMFCAQGDAGRLAFHMGCRICFLLWDGRLGSAFIFNEQHSHLESVASISLTTSQHTCSIEENHQSWSWKRLIDDQVFQDHLLNSLNLIDRHLWPPMVTYSVHQCHGWGYMLFLEWRPRIVQLWADLDMLAKCSWYLTCFVSVLSDLCPVGRAEGTAAIWESKRWLRKRRPREGTASGGSRPCHRHGL